jgi:hypothetical protein
MFELKILQVVLFGKMRIHMVRWIRQLLHAYSEYRLMTQPGEAYNDSGNWV